MNVLDILRMFGQLGPAMYQNAETAPPRDPAISDLPMAPIDPGTDVPRDYPATQQPAVAQNPAAETPPQQSAPRPRSAGGGGSPVVTEGTAATTPAQQPEPYQDFFSMLERMQRLRETREPSPLGMTPTEERALERLGALGAAMASTRSPTFQGAFGEGLRALQGAATSQRQESRQQQQLDTEAAYRAATEARQQAELEFARDPNNPINQLRVAQTRQAEAAAQAVLMNARTAAAGAGRERLGTGYITRNPQTGQYQVEYPAAAGGAQIRPFSGVPASAQASEQRLRQSDFAAAERAGVAARTDLARRGISVTDEQARAAYERAYNDSLQRRSILRQQGIDPDMALPGGGGGTATPPGIVLDPAGRTPR